MRMSQMMGNKSHSSIASVIDDRVHGKPAETAERNGKQHRPTQESNGTIFNLHKSCLSAVKIRANI